MTWRTFNSRRWNYGRRTNGLTRYEAALEFIRLGDILRTMIRAGITPTVAHGERLSELSRMLDRSSIARHIPQQRAEVESGASLRFPEWAR